MVVDLISKSRSGGVVVGGTQPRLEVRIPFHLHLACGQVDGQHTLPGIGQQAFAIIQAASARLDHHYIIGARLPLTRPASKLALPPRIVIMHPTVEYIRAHSQLIRLQRPQTNLRNYMVPEGNLVRLYPRMRRVFILDRLALQGRRFPWYDKRNRECELGRRPGKGKPSANEVRVMSAKLWRELDAEKKRPFEEMAEEQKVIYAGKMREFNEAAGEWDRRATEIKGVWERENPLPGGLDGDGEVGRGGRRRRGRGGGEGSESLGSEREGDLVGGSEDVVGGVAKGVLGGSEEKENGPGGDGGKESDGDELMGE